MTAKGPEASLTVLPVMLAGRPFEKVTEVLGVVLEQRGLQHIEFGRAPFTTGVGAEASALSAALAAFLKANPVATDYALYAEFNGQTLDALRAVVVDKAGEVVWTDHQTTHDDAFRALGPRRDPMTLIAFLADRLSAPLNLTEDTAKKRSHKLEDAFGARSGYAPAVETGERMPARLNVLKESRSRATLMVIGVRTSGAVNVTAASDLARRLGEAKLFQTTVLAQTPLLVEARLTGDQLSYLWAIARKVQAHVKTSPPDADYVLYADYLFDPQHWQRGGVQFVVCDRHGDWVLAELTNSDQEDYQRVKPISAEGCDTLLLERLTRRLRE